MEEDIHIYKSRPVKTSEKIEKRLEKAIDLASDKLDYIAAHDSEIVRALKIVEAFIKRKKRVCYGGTAMNAILPPSKRFYDPEKDLPDYDFYTPEPDKDVKELVKELEDNKFSDVYKKMGMHEGTQKVLVNYVPVADISFIEPELFTVMYRRSIQIEGLHYTDPVVLRMMMYLELSRPQGEVSRWKKVFERLQLVNNELPIRANCKGEIHDIVRKNEFFDQVLDFCIREKRIVCNGPLATIYKQGIRRGHTLYDGHSHVAGPVLFTSPDPMADAKAIKEKLNSDGVRMFLHRARGELVPQRVELRHDNKPVCMIIQETACHSFNIVKTRRKESVHIASLEFLITLYISMDVFTFRATEYIGSHVLCKVKRFIELAYENYMATQSQFPPFSLKCRGHQVSYVSLIKAKVERKRKEKRSATRKASSMRSRNTTKRERKDV